MRCFSGPRFDGLHENRCYSLMIFDDFHVIICYLMNIVANTPYNCINLHMSSHVLMLEIGLEMFFVFFPGNRAYWFTPCFQFLKLTNLCACRSKTKQLLKSVGKHPHIVDPSGSSTLLAGTELNGGL